MPRTFDPGERRKLYLGIGDGLSYAVDLVTATAVWAGIGYLIDRWLGTWPVLFAIGAVLGNATGIYVLYRKSAMKPNDGSRSYAAGVTRKMPSKAAPAIGETQGDAGDGES